MARLPYDQLVFSGGGLRCFWHGGFLSALEEVHDLAPVRVTGSSGGALSAAAWIAGVEQELFDRFKRAIAEQDDNVTLRAMGDDHGRSPHQRIYTRIISDVIDADAMARIADGMAFQINLSTPGVSVAPTLRALIGGTLYHAEQAVAATPRPRLASITGMKQRLVDARVAARDGTLPELIRMAATVPPAFRADRWKGEVVFDGGMVNKAPLPDPDAGPTLILLTKRFRILPDDDGGRITYVQPSQDVLPGDKLNFTDPDLLAKAWKQGEEDGRRWRNKIT